jgi:hypothetical protein
VDPTFEQSALRTSEMARRRSPELARARPSVRDGGDGTDGTEDDVAAPRVPGFYARGPRPSASSPAARPSSPALEAARANQLAATEALIRAEADRARASAAQDAELRRRAAFVPGVASAGRFTRGDDDVDAAAAGPSGSSARNERGAGFAGSLGPKQFGEFKRFDAESLFDLDALRAYRARVGEQARGRRGTTRARARGDGEGAASGLGGLRGADPTQSPNAGDASKRPFLSDGFGTFDAFDATLALATGKASARGGETEGRGPG